MPPVIQAAQKIEFKPLLARKPAANVIIQDAFLSRKDSLEKSGITIMAGVTRSRSSIFLVIALLALASGCTRLPKIETTSIKARNLGELQGYLLNHKPDVDQFRFRGPFAVAVQENFEIRPSPNEPIDTDLFLSANTDKAPLVIFLHGHESRKEAHTYQAMHLASWGMHCLTVQLPNNGPWDGNGKTLANIARFIYRLPEIIDRRIDAKKIILAGHSYGGYAVAIALAEGAPVAGGILLDPAVAGDDLPAFFRQINTPLMVLGADEHVSMAHHREYFFRFVRSGIAEISIKDATHEDGQWPSLFAVATEESQIAFASALTSAAFSLSSTGRFDYAWASFGDALEKGALFNAKKK